MACRTVRVSNGEDVREDISTLVGRMQELKSAVTQDANGLATWCRDGVGGLWEEMSRFQLISLLQLFCGTLEMS